MNTKKPYLRRIELKRETIANVQDSPFAIPAVRALDILEFHADVTFLVGENGSGKSTLIEAIAMGMGFGPEGGTKNMHLTTTDDISGLHRHLRFIKSFARPKDGFFLRAESFYNVATHMDQVGYLGGYGERSVHARSHGEAFMATLTGKFRRAPYALYRFAGLFAWHHACMRPIRGRGRRGARLRVRRAGCAGHRYDPASRRCHGGTERCAPGAREPR